MTTVLDAVDNTALCTAIGAVACMRWVQPPGGPTSKRTRRLLGFCAIVLTCTTAAMLIQRAHVLSRQPYSSLTPVLAEVLSHTHYGRVWLIRLGSIAALWVALWLGWGRLRRLPWSGTLLAILAVTAFSRSATGHSADQGDFTAHEIMDWLHIVVGSLWAGAVVAAAATLFNAEGAGTGAAGFTDTARRLSALATVAFVMVLATGLYNATVQLNDLSSLWRTEYGRHLALKVSLAVIMLGLGALNRFRYLGDLPAAGSAPAGAIIAMRRFVQVLYMEAVAALGVFISAALLTNTAPPHGG